MGGRGSGGTRNTASEVPIQTRVENFIQNLNDREYGSSTKQVPERQQQEYRALKREIINHIDTWGNEDGNLIIFSSGFARNDNYLHTPGKLNAYQRIVRSEAKNIKIDLQLGVITPEQAEKELFALRSIDATIERRRQILKEWA